MAPTAQENSDRLLHLEWENKALWKEIEELKAEAREQRLYRDQSAKQYSAILGSIVAACIVLIINAGVIWLKVGK